MTRASRLFLGAFFTLLFVAVAGAGSFKVGDAIPVKDVKHTDPHRGTTWLRDATLTFEGYSSRDSVKNQLLVTSEHDIKASGQFIVVLYNVQNHANDVLDSYPLFFGGCALTDDKGNSFPISKVSGQFAQDLGRDMQGKRIGPGEKMQSCVVFEIPAGAKPASLKLDLIDATIDLGAAEMGTPKATP